MGRFVTHFAPVHNGSCWSAAGRRAPLRSWLLMNRYVSASTARSFAPVDSRAISLSTLTQFSTLGVSTRRVRHRPDAALEAVTNGRLDPNNGLPVKTSAGACQPL